MAIRADNERMLTESKNFKLLFDAEWPYVVNSAARKRKHVRDLNKPAIIPETQDLVKLRKYLLEEMATEIKPKRIKQPPENICQTGFWQTRLILLVDLEVLNHLIYII